MTAFLVPVELNDEFSVNYPNLARIRAEGRLETFLGEYIEANLWQYEEIAGEGWDEDDDTGQDDGLETHPGINA